MEVSNPIVGKLLNDIEAFKQIVMREQVDNPESWSEAYLGNFILYDTKFRAASKALNLEYPIEVFGTPDEVMEKVISNFHKLQTLTAKVRTELLYADLAAQSEAEYGVHNADTLLLTDTQKSEIQTQINSLRENLQSSQWLSDEHQQRLLKKINEFQAEFDKNIGSYYKKLGMLEDLGDSLGEFGKSAKPFGDLVDKITGSFKVFRRQNPQIGKDSDPLQIEDQSDEGDDE